jgi:hypothetical protein
VERKPTEQQEEEEQRKKEIKKERRRILRKQDVCVRTGPMWLTIWINSGPENLTGSETGADFVYYMTGRRLKDNPVGTGTHCNFLVRGEK